MTIIKATSTTTRAEKATQTQRAVQSDLCGKMKTLWINVNVSSLPFEWKPNMQFEDWNREINFADTLRKKANRFICRNREMYIPPKFQCANFDLHAWFDFRSATHPIKAGVFAHRLQALKQRYDVIIEILISR